jgi:signal transduction histidine kinase
LKHTAKNKKQLIEELEELHQQRAVEHAAEQVREAVLAMRGSPDLLDVVGVMHQTLHQLGVNPLSTSITFIDPAEEQAQIYLAGEDMQAYGFMPTTPAWAIFQAAKAVEGGFHVSWINFPINNTEPGITASRHAADVVLAAWREGRISSIVESISLERIHEWWQPLDPDKADWSVFESELGECTFTLVPFQNGVVSYRVRTPSDTHVTWVQTLTEALSLGYVRFLDFQRLEQQAHQAQVEAALERVRAQALGMQGSDELSEVTSVLFEQFRRLGYDLHLAAIIVQDEASETTEWWSEFVDGRRRHSRLPLTQGRRQLEEMNRVRDKGAAWFVYDLEGEALHRYCREVFATSGSSEQEVEEALRRLPERIVSHRVFHQRGWIAFGLKQRLSDDDLAVAKRFTDVFNFAYDRFLELKTLEAQNRELQVEAALERVRSRAQGMRSSDDIGAVTTQLFREFNDLGIPVRRSGIWILDAESGKGEIWLTEPTGALRKGEPFDLSVMETPNLVPLYEAFRHGEPHFHIERTVAESVDDVRRFRDLLRLPFEYVDEDPAVIADMLSAASPEGHFHAYYVMLPQGMIFLARVDALSEEELEIARRFAGVFGFTYSRMQEIARAEQAARQAERRAAVDQVRAEIAAMRTTDDFERVTPLLWQTLKVLGVTFHRCGMTIHDRETESVSMYLSDREGNPIASTDTSIDAHPMLRASYDAWMSGEPYAQRFTRDEFMELTAVGRQGIRTLQAEQYVDATTIPENMVIQTVPFSHGTLYINSEQALSREDLSFVNDLATAFSVAYARFLDFQQLEEQNIQIQEATRLKSDFLARMSHDLRTPMNAIIGYTRILLRQVKDSLNARQYRNLDNIQISANNLLSLINDILDLSKIEAGHINIKPEAVDLKQLAIECIASVESLVKPGVQLQRQLTDVSAVQTDADRIRRVVMNLLSNALKFTERGSITVSLQPVDDWIELSVADTGMGIPPEDLPHIFDEFRQVEGGKTQEGTGLGLSIVKKSIALLGGTIEVESEVKKGTKFTLQITDYEA